MNPSLSEIWLSFPRPIARSRRAQQVIDWFGLNRKARKAQPKPLLAASDLLALLPQPGQILLITGPSGAGKSFLLRALGSFFQDSLVDLNQIHPPARPVVDCLDPLPLADSLNHLSRFGLAEAWTYLRTPDELSEGQRWRLRLAMALLDSEPSGPKTLICDEFAAVLDRITAAVVARGLRRFISASKRFGAILVTSHDDLRAALQADIHVVCDFGAVRIARPIDEMQPSTRRACG